MSGWGRTLLMLAGGLAGLGALSCVGLCIAVALSFHFPDEVEELAVVSGDAPTLAPGSTVKVLVWNIQFAGGRDAEFFYDGGEAVSVPPETVQATLARVAETIRRHDPDIVLLQEVDRNSRRTGLVDQHLHLVEALGYPAHVTATYHQNPYVPSPGHEHLGRVDMHLTVMSRFRLGAAARHQLALLDEPAWRRLFNLRRALLQVAVPLEGGGELTLFNTHLSAFSGGDETVDLQIGEILEVTAGTTGPWLLAGDFNALPPGDDPARLPDADLYPSDAWPMQILFDQTQPAVPLAELTADPQPWRTYVDYGATSPDRVLDYVFYGPGVEGRTYLVDTRAIGISDHLPLVATLTAVRE